MRAGRLRRFWIGSGLTALVVFGTAATAGADPAARADAAGGGTATQGKIGFHSGSPYDARQGFAVPHRPDCPPESRRKGDQPPAAFEEWCERGGIKHGWYAQWHSNGRPAVAGEYREGLRVGVWTRWYPSGVKRVQAEFRDGLQHGRLIAWDERGRKLGEQRFESGSAVKGR